MSKNDELILAMTGNQTNWEDEEKIDNDLQSLRREYRKRLYRNPVEDESVTKKNKDSVCDES
jgi:hypothetical protein